MEATGKTSSLSRDLRNLLKDIDGKVSVSELLDLGKMAESKLLEALNGLEKDGYVREFVAQRDESARSPAGRVPGSQPPSESGEDLDFTAFKPAKPPARTADNAKLQAQAQEIARQAQVTRAREEAGAKARAEAAARAKAEAEMRARVLPELGTTIDRQASSQGDALDRARREAEERQRREAEEKDRREAEVRARIEADLAVRRQAEEGIRREQSEKARREAGEKAKREQEAQARREAEDRVRREAEERARREIEELTRKEIEARRAREEAERRKREEEERARKEAEERERRRREEREQAERAARIEAEARAKVEAELRARRESEERARREEEERREQESGRRAEDEARKRREAEELENLERSLREQEQQARLEAEQAEGEQQARREEERFPGESEEEEQRAKEEEAGREKEEAKRAREEERAQARAEAKEAEKRRKAERAGERAGEEAWRGDEDAARASGEETLSARAAWARRKPRSLSKQLALLLLVILVAGVAALPFVPLDPTGYERAAQEWLGEPVKIGSVTVSLVPTPQLKFEKVAIGRQARMRVALIRATPEIGSLLSERKTLKRLELDHATLPREYLGALLVKGKGGWLGVERIVAKRLKIDIPELNLPPLDLEAAVAPDGSLVSVTLSSTEPRLSVKLQPLGGRASIEIASDSVPLPLGADFPVNDFQAKGTVTRSELALSSVEGRAYGGRLRGNARLRWSDGWSLAGEFEARQLEAAKIATPLVGAGTLGGKATYSMKGLLPERLLLNAQLEGSFAIQKGSINNVDMTRLLQGSSTGGGTTPFSEMSGSVSADPNRLLVRQIRMAAGLLNGTGQAEMDPQKNLSGRLQIELRAQTVQARATVAITGTLKDPQFRRSN